MALPLHLLDVEFEREEFVSKRSPKGGESAYKPQLSGHRNVNVRNRCVSSNGRRSTTFQGLTKMVNESAVFKGRDSPAVVIESAILNTHTERATSQSPKSDHRHIQKQPVEATASRDGS